MRLLFGIFSVTAALGGRAWGEPPSAKLEYERGAGADSCPDEARVRREVGAILGYDPFHDEAALAIRCVIDRRQGWWEANILVRDRFTGAGGARVISSELDDCDELARSVELTLALVIDPLFQPEPRPPPTASGLDPAAGPSRAAIPAVGSTAATPARNVYFHAGARLGAGLQPGMTAGFAAGFGVRWEWLSVDVDGGYAFHTTRALPSGAISAARLWGALIPCAHLGRLAGCAIATGGVITASGDFQIDGQAETPWIGAGARAVAEVPLWAPFSLRAQVDLLFPLLRTTFTVSGEAVWEAPVFGAELGAVVVAHFR